MTARLIPPTCLALFSAIVLFSFATHTHTHMHAAVGMPGMLPVQLYLAFNFFL